MIIFKAKEFSVKEKLQEAKKDPAGTAKKIGKATAKFAKENPQDFALLGAGYGVPLTGAALAKKAGKGKLALGFAGAAALPLGEGAVAARHGIKAYMNRKKKNK